LLLVNLWASYCTPCLSELAEWSAAADKFREGGIEVLALNADGVIGIEDAKDKAQAAIAKTGFPFAWAEADSLTVRSLDIFSSAVLDLWKPLPVPSSFLVDAEGEVLAIYKGPAPAETVIADAALATATPEARRNAAVPFPGRWVEGPGRADSLRVASQLLDRDESASAARYLEDLVGVLAARAKDETGKRDLGDARYFLAILLDQMGKLPEAQRELEGAREVIPQDIRVRTILASVYQRRGEFAKAAAEITAAITINPSDLLLHDQLGELHVRQGQFAEAVQRFGMILKIDPNRAATRYQMANAMLRNGQGAEAVAEFKQTLSSNPRLFDAANQLARVLSSHPDERLRSHQEALELAMRLCQLSQNKDPRFLDTQATAAAANGRFVQAVTSAEMALALYRADPAHAGEVKPLEARLDLFREKKIWVETEWR
jgi:tetratricopeptide (TPR) repeat protein